MHVVMLFFQFFFIKRYIYDTFLYFVSWLFSKSCKNLGVYPRVSNSGCSLWSCPGFRVKVGTTSQPAFFFRKAKGVSLWRWWFFTEDSAIVLICKLKIIKFQILTIWKMFLVKESAAESLGSFDKRFFRSISVWRGFICFRFYTVRLLPVYWRVTAMLAGGLCEDRSLKIDYFGKLFFWIDCILFRYNPKLLELLDQFNLSCTRRLRCSR